MRKQIHHLRAANFLVLVLAGCAASIEDHVRFLASPDLEGRETGSEGERKAAAYIAAGMRRAGLEVSLQEFKGHGATIRNVIGVLRGASDEAVVIGAHYDHLGWRKGEIHPGADDNASGTAALLDLAARLTRSPPRRTLVLAAFSGEEIGLIGSSYYVTHPAIPLEKTVAMINLDMVGRLRDKVTVFGADTGDRFREYLAGSEIPLAFPKDPFGPSDHRSFLMKEVPSVHIFTGTHSDWHKPGDTPEKLDYAGMKRVIDLVEKLARRIADAPERMKFQKVEVQLAPQPSPGGRPYFGSMPDYSFEGKGVRMDAITPRSPADKAGLKAGDVIVALDDVEITDVNVYTQALFARKPGAEMRVAYLREGKRETTKAVLAERKRSDE